MSLLAGSLAFTAATLLSRISGLARDVTLAAVYGASVALDAYMISIIFPFFLRKIFGEGAMGSSFIPYYKTSKNRNEFTSSVINTFLLITFIIVLLVEIFPDFVPYIFSMGYETSGKETIERLVRITAFFIPEVFLWAIFYSILNSHGKYFLPALTPLFMNLGVIIGTWIGKDPMWSAMGFVIGGGSATLVLGIEAAKYFKYTFTFRGMGKFVWTFLKAASAMMANQFNLLVDTNVASFLGMGAISYLQLASRLYQLPLGLFGVAVSTVALSVMSGEEEEKEKKMKDAVQTVLLLTFPAFVGILILPEKLTFLIYGFGKFGENAVTITADVLRMYSIGIVPYSLFYIGLRYHHSSKRMGIPLLATLIVSSSNALLDIILALALGVKGVALATSLAGIIGLMFFVIRKELNPGGLESIKIAGASLLMGAFLIFLKDLSHSRIYTLLLVFIAMGAYYAFLKLFKSSKVREIEKIIRISH